MTPSEVSKLKQGDVVRHTATGAGYIVLSNRAGVPIVVRTLEIHNAPEWEHFYTPTPVVARFTAVPPAPVGLTQMVNALEECGWKYDETLGNGRWVAPDGNLFSSLTLAHANRNNYPGPQKPKSFTSFAEARIALRDAGWQNPYGKTWRSPSGDFFDGARAAFAALTGGGNPS